MNRKETARRLYQLLADQNAETEKRWARAGTTPKTPDPPTPPPRKLKPLDMACLQQWRARWAARRLGISSDLTDAEVRFLSSPAVLRRARAVSRFHE